MVARPTWKVNLMRSIGLPQALCVWFLFLLAVPSSEPADAKIRSFAVPSKMLPIGEALTPNQSEARVSAVDVEMRKPESSKQFELGLGELDWSRMTSISLGSLDTGVVVEFRHSPARGNGGCPMWVFSRNASGYHNLIKAAGWGFSLAPSRTSVPDVVLLEYGSGRNRRC